MQTRLYHEDHFRADVLFNGDTPTEIIFYYKESPFVTLYLDAIDWMVFGFLPDLNCLSLKEQSIFIRLLANLIHKDLGGKILLQIDKANVDLLQEQVGLGIRPVFPEGFEFFNNLMYLKIEKQHLGAAFKNYQNAFQKLAQSYTIILDKAKLVQCADEASRLLIDHAPWAGEDPLNRIGYGEIAMVQRFTNQHIQVFAAINNETLAVDGLVRVYQAGLMYYLGDLVVHSAHRGQGLAMYLMQAAMNNIRDQSTLTLIAGNTGLINMYQKLGFHTLSDHAPLYLSKDKVLVCALIPRQTILQHYFQGFPLPDPPKKADGFDSSAKIL